LNEVMPDFTVNNLQQHEWDKHGVCYLKLLNDRLNGRHSQPSREFSRRVFVKYFETIVHLYERLTSRFNLTKE